VFKQEESAVVLPRQDAPPVISNAFFDEDQEEIDPEWAEEESWDAEYVSKPNAKRSREDFASGSQDASPEISKKPKLSREERVMHHM
jgi:hypothetical protein